jgi:hypothetical protein
MSNKLDRTYELERRQDSAISRHTSRPFYLDRIALRNKLLHDWHLSDKEGVDLESIRFLLDIMENGPRWRDSDHETHSDEKEGDNEEDIEE